MANVLFKRGLSTALASITPEDGTFYLTTDTNKMYVANEDKKLVELSQSIVSVTELPVATSAEIGAFYYVTGDNILAVSNGKTWTQINPDTDTNTFLSSVESTVSESGNIVTIDTEYTMSEGTVGGDDSFSLSSINGTVDFTVNNKKIDLNAKNDLITKAGADDNTAIISVKHNGAEISGTDTAVLKGGTNVTIEGDSTGITVSAKDIHASGHTLDFNGSGILASSIVMSEGDSLNATITPKIRLKDENKATKATDYKFTNGTMALDAYSTDAVDKLIEEKYQAHDAMVFKGTLGKTSGDGSTIQSLPTSGVNIGDTYKVSTAQTITGVGELKVGDLIIAQEITSGEEGGTTQTIKWVVIPSGDEEIYTFTKSGTGWSILGSAGNGMVTSYTDDDVVILTPTITETNGKVTNTLKGSHKTYFSSGSDTVTESSESQIYLRNINYDKYGHVIGSTDQSISIADKVSDIAFLKDSVAKDNDKQTLSYDVQVVQRSGTTVVDKAFTIETNSLSIESSVDEKLIIDLVWGTF